MSRSRSHRHDRGRWRPASAELVIAAATLLGLALRVYQLTRPGLLSGVDEYDDGVYFGSAVRLIHGLVPYRDFVLVHPPGITLLMTPIAFVTQGGGTAGGFAVARVITALASVASIAVVGLLVRHRGALAAAVACGVMAAYPAGINAAHTVQLEPWLVLFCALGALAAFDGDELHASSRRLAWAGLALGFACAVKLWGLIPVVALLAVCLRRAHRPALRPVVLGLVLGFGVPVAPFFALAPHAFIRDVIVAQLTRVDVARVPGVDRLTDLSGLNVFAHVAHGPVYLLTAALAVVVVAGVAVSSLRERRGPPALDAFVLLAAVLALVAFLYPADFYDHYAWFFAPFLGLTVGLSVTRLLAGLRGSLGIGIAAALGVLVAVVVIVPAAMQFHQLSRLAVATPGARAQREIPAGSCVLTDVTALIIISNRFVSTTRGCSAMIDAIGSDYALSKGHNGVNGAGATPAVKDLWLTALRHAQYVWLGCPPRSSPGCLTDRRIPWTAPILDYFRTHFAPLRGHDAVPNVYARRA